MMDEGNEGKPFKEREPEEHEPEAIRGEIVVPAVEDTVYVTRYAVMMLAEPWTEVTSYEAAYRVIRIALGLSPETPLFTSEWRKRGWLPGISKRLRPPNGSPFDVHGDVEERSVTANPELAKKWKEHASSIFPPQHPDAQILRYQRAAE